MLYTVSGVQILATLDAFDDLEARVPGGRQKIAKCRFLYAVFSILHAYFLQT